MGRRGDKDALYLNAIGPLSNLENYKKLQCIHTSVKPVPDDSATSDQDV
jgi:hypothetical protein